MKFLVDMPLSPEMPVWLRSLGHMAVHAGELSLHRAPDTQILARAVEDGCVVISAELDFPRLLALLVAAAPGLILLRGGNYSESESLECVRRVLMALPADKLPSASSSLIERVSGDDGRQLCPAADLSRKGVCRSLPVADSRNGTGVPAPTSR